MSDAKKTGLVAVYSSYMGRAAQQEVNYLLISERIVVKQTKETIV
jgi:hypothetical protein